MTLDGREAIRFVSADGDATYLVDADTYDPIEWTTRGEGGSSTLRFTAYERLPLNDATEKLTDLTAQHPDARVVKDPAEYAAAQARLFPKG